jgi:translation initiation factor 4E
VFHFELLLICLKILCLIGEAFEHSDEICGAVVNIRGKGDKIGTNFQLKLVSVCLKSCVVGVWTSDANKGNAVLEIGKKLKERLHIPPRTVLGYQVHKDTQDKSGSVTKNSYTV